MWREERAATSISQPGEKAWLMLAEVKIACQVRVSLSLSPSHVLAAANTYHWGLALTVTTFINAACPCAAWALDLQACRLSKVKCEQQPSGACGRCARLRLQCEPSTPAKRGRPAKASAEHLPRPQQDLAVPQTGDEIEARTKQPHVETISALAAAVNEIVIAP